MACAMAAGLLAAGCGGGDGGGDQTAAEPLSKAEYIAQGDQICAEGTLKITEEAQKALSGTPSSEDAQQFVQDVLVPTFRELADDLRALPPPPGDEQTTAAIYDALEEGLDALAADPAVFLEPHTGGVFDQANRLAQAYGFKQCGED
jgi:hypothetical protein